MSTVVIGLGNELCADDAVGLQVARRIPGAIEGGCPGLGLLDLIAGHAKAVLVDAVVSGAPPGTIHRFTLADLPDRKLLPQSLHGVNAVDALALGRVAAPEALPAEVIIIGVEIADRTPYREGLSPAVAVAVPLAVEAVRKEMRGQA
jgi:hydrogenase maturation protease